MFEWYTNDWEVPSTFCNHIPHQFLKWIQEEFPLLGMDDITVGDFKIVTKYHEEYPEQQYNKIEPSHIL